MTLDEKKKDAESFLSSQLAKLTDEEKEKLAYVLFGATMGKKLLVSQPSQPSPRVGG